MSAHDGQLEPIEPVEPGLAGPRPQGTRGRRRWVRWAGWIVLAALLFGVCLTVMVVLLQQPLGGLESAVETARRLRKVGVAIQAAIAGLVLWRWPSIARWCGERGVVLREEVPVLEAARWKVAAVLGIYLVLAAGGLSAVAGLFASLP